MYMPWMVILGLTFMATTSFAQQSIECKLMQERISGNSSGPSLCLAIYQQCSETAKKSSNPQPTQNQCSVGLGECQMGGALSGDALQQAIKKFKKLCEK
ncbi:MAG: hypothetical protein WCT47_15970 [Betaproteobacteria bacterium]|jgi:hypothetical protein